MNKSEQRKNEMQFIYLNTANYEAISLPVTES